MVEHLPEEDKASSGFDKDAHQVWLDKQKIQIEQRKLHIEQQKVEVSARTTHASSHRTLIGVLFTAVVSLTIALSGTITQLLGSKADFERAVALQQSKAEFEIERQDKELQYQIIKDATTGSDLVNNKQNLLLMVEMGILDDPDGLIKEAARNDKLPNFGPLAPVNALNLGETGLDVIKQFSKPELSKVTRQDGIQIIGYNHWVRSDFIIAPDNEVVYLSQETITLSEADKLLRYDLIDIEDVVNAGVRVPLTQTQFDALVSFVSSIGPQEFRRSELLFQINQGNFDAVPKLMKEYVYANNIEDSTLHKRRTLEAVLWQHTPR